MTRGPGPGVGRRRPLRAVVAALALLVGADAVLAPRAAADTVKVEVEGLGGALGGLGKLSLEGSDLRQNVLSALGIEAARGEKDLSAGRIRRLYEDGPGEIRTALEPFGFYDAEIRSDLRGENGKWVASYTIDPGEAVRISSIRVSVAGPGAEEEAFRKAVAEFPLKDGDVLFHPAYEAGKARFEQAAAKRGFLDGRFVTHAVRVDLDRYTSSVELRYDTGPRYRFGPVTFRQDILDPDLLEGYVTWKRGDPFDTTRLLTLQSALAASSYYARVEVRMEKEEAVDREVPVVVDLEPAKPHKYSLGAGWGTDTGPRVSAGVDFRRVNRLGHRASVKGSYSRIEKLAEANYVIPGKYPRTDAWTLFAGYSKLDTDTSDSETYLAGGNYARSVGKWRQTLSLSYQREDFVVASQSGVAKLFTPGASWTLVQADDRLFARRGFRIDLGGSGAVDGVLSNVGYLRLTARGKGILSLDAEGRERLIGRVDVGWLTTNDFAALPPRVRFFAGGDQSVRGYAFEALGPVDAQGDVIGGNTLATGSISFEHYFLDRWGAAVFVDSGNAFHDFSGPLKTGVGAGVRWRSPVGPVYVDVGFGLNGPSKPVFVSVRVGPDL